MVADGTWMAVDGADGCGWTRMVRMVVAVACDYQVECKEEKKYLLDAWGQPACDFSMTLEVVVVVVVPWWQRLTVDV